MLKALNFLCAASADFGVFLSGDSKREESDGVVITTTLATLKLEQAPRAKSHHVALSPSSNIFCKPQIVSAKPSSNPAAESEKRTVSEHEAQESVVKVEVAVDVPDAIMSSANDDAVTNELALSIRKRCVISANEAIQIFVAKQHNHEIGDHLASRLATEFSLTNKAIRDIWNLRTWGPATKPYWTLSDTQLSLRKDASKKIKGEQVRRMQEFPYSVTHIINVKF